MSNLFLTLMLVLVVDAVLANGIPVKTQIAPGELIRLGNIDDKDYYIVYNRSMTWNLAGEFCRGNNLTLGTIRSDQQNKLLRTSFTELNIEPGLEFWTGAREARFPAYAYRWNASWETVELFSTWTLSHPRVQNVPYATCVTMTIYNADELAVFSAPCREFVQGTLCETPETTSSFRNKLLSEVERQAENDLIVKVEIPKRKAKSIGKDKNMKTRVGKHAPGELTFVGEVEGKEYYEVDGLPMGWTEAGEFCKQHNLTLATITSQGQNDFLETAFNALNIAPYQEFWTDARDAQFFQEAFRWNDTLDGLEWHFTQWTMSPRRFYGTPYATCGVMSLDFQYHTQMETAGCVERIQGTLCETPMWSPVAIQKDFVKRS